MRTTAATLARPTPDNPRTWMMQQAEILRNRLDALRQRESVLRGYDAMRARLCWNEDRHLDAEELAAGLSRRPEAIRARLSRSRHGTLWLIQRWKALGAILDRESTWSEAQARLAFDLLGISTSFRDGDPWISAGMPTAKALVERELQSLQATLAGTLDALDEFERREAIEGRPVRPSREMRQLRREESDCWRRLDAIQKLIAEDTSRQASAEDPSSDPEEFPSDPPRPRAALPMARALDAPCPSGNRRARRAAMRLQRQSSRPR